MAEVKWIKISTTMFTSSRKIKQIEHMPEGDTILVIWLKLLLLAGNVNDGGAIYITPEIPYTEEMLADELQRPLNIVKIALSVFERFEMIEIVDDILYLSAWEKHQNTDKLSEIREYNRLAQKRAREKRKLLSSGSDVNDKSMTSQESVNDISLTNQLHCQPCQDTDIDIDIDKDIDKDIYINIVAYLNEKANTKYKHSSKKTKSHIKARLDEGFTFEDFKTVIDKKCAEWVGTTFEQYLRPETLFGTKFESYLNAKVVPKKDDTKATIDETKTDLDELF